VLQAVIDEYGCRKVMASLQMLNEKEWLHPLRLECCGGQGGASGGGGGGGAATVLLVRNTTDKNILVEWDKVKEGRKWEVLVACPACERSIKIRAGVLGTVKCPLPVCSRIYLFQ
jgi:hypothetical protein